MPSFKSLLKGITIIYFTQIMVQVLSALVIYYLIYSGQVENSLSNSGQTLKYVLYVLCPLGAVAGHMIYRQSIGVIDMAQPLHAKFVNLRTAVLIRSACLEVPSLFGVAASMLTGDSSFLLFTAIMVALFFVWRPTKESVAEELQLTPAEMEF